MTFTIDESVIALWPWAAGVAYFSVSITLARLAYRHRLKNQQPDNTPDLDAVIVFFSWPLLFVLALMFLPLVAVYELFWWLITWRNGE
jgi:hypothetical protein